ncbi:MAG: hypothetical protein WD470_09655 [Rhodospirillaceae bacterium]
MSAFPAIGELGSESLANEQLMAFVSDAGTRDSVRAAVCDRWPNAVLHDGGLAAALGALSQEASPQLLVVDISGSEDPNAGMRSLLALCDRATRVVAIGTVNDIGYYRQLLALGVSEYIVKPLEASLLAAALDGAGRPRPVLHAVETEAARSVVSVVGARGGVGASTIAVNLAWIAAHELRRNSVLIDLDLQFGTVGLQLDLEPSHGLREALENPDRIDSLFVASAMTAESENLFVLSAEEPFDEAVRFPAGACATLLDALPEGLETVIFDIPARSAVETPALLRLSDRIVLVSDLSLVGMRDVARLARLCREAAPDAALSVVVNKAGLAKKGEIPKTEFVRGAELAVAHSIPFDGRVAAQASGVGRPFPAIAPRAPAVKALRRLAADILRRPGAEPRNSALTRLLPFRRKQA